MIRILALGLASVAALFGLRHVLERVAAGGDDEQRRAAAASVEPLAPDLPAPTRGLAVYHLGHSLVGRDMPAMVAQLAAALGHDDHVYASQLGWGTTLRAHLGPTAGINGFDAENAHPHFRPARATIEAGAFEGGAFGAPARGGGGERGTRGPSGDRPGASAGASTADWSGSETGIESGTTHGTESGAQRIAPAPLSLEHAAAGPRPLDALILTEMVELADAIRYHDAPGSFLAWVELARAARPDLAVYLYETWHPLDHPDGFVERLDRDPDLLWRQLLAPAWAAGQPVHVIPAGRALAALARALAENPLPDLPSHTALFATNADGTQDPIHLNDLGHYYIALVHVAVLYHVDTLGLPHTLLRATGTPATPPTPAAATLMQRTVDHLMRDVRGTGLAPRSK